MFPFDQLRRQQLRAHSRSKCQDLPAPPPQRQQQEQEEGRTYRMGPGAQVWIAPMGTPQPQSQPHRMVFTPRPTLQTIDQLHQLLRRARQVDEHAAASAGTVPVSMSQPQEFMAAAVAGMAAMAEACGVSLESFGYLPGDLPDPEP